VCFSPYVIDSTDWIIIDAINASDKFIIFLDASDGCTGCQFVTIRAACAAVVEVCFTIILVIISDMLVVVFIESRSARTTT